MSSPKKNVAYEFYISLVDSADTGAFKAAPTIAAGDFKVSSDGVGVARALQNLATLPSVDPAGSIMVKISLSQNEMNSDKLLVQCIDAAGDEWDDVLIFIDATVANVDDIVRSTTPANRLDVTVTGEAGLDLDNTSGTLNAAQIDNDTIDLFAQGLTGVTWYADKTGNDGNTGKSWGSGRAFLTVGAAITAASAGDRIKIGAGTFTESADASGKTGLILIGSGPQTYIHPASGVGLTVADRTLVRSMKIESDDSAGLNAGSKDDVTLVDVIAIGTLDGLIASGTNRLRIENSYLKGTYDGVNLQTAVDFLINNSVIETDGSYSSGVDTRAVYAGGVVCRGKINGGILRATRNIETAKVSEAFGCVGTAANIDIQLTNVLIRASQSHVSATGAVSAVSGAVGVGSQGSILLNGCTLYSSNAGSGSEYDLNQSAGVLAVGGGTLYDTTKTNGTITQLVEAEVNDALVALNLDHLVKEPVNDNADMTTKWLTGRFCRTSCPRRATRVRMLWPMLRRKGLPTRSARSR